MFANRWFSRKWFFLKGIGDALQEKPQIKPFCCSQEPFSTRRSSGEITYFYEILFIVMHPSDIFKVV